MPNVRNGRQIDAALCKKGFHRELDGKHIRYFFNERIFTFMSLGDMGSTIGAPLISLMARQLRLTKAQFLELIDCTLDETAYQDILRTQETEI